MRYEKPTERMPSEITDLLRQPGISPQERVDAVLTALFFSETANIAGDILVHEFSKARLEEKLLLKNLFETFYQTWGTTYKIDDSIHLLSQFVMEHPKYSDEVRETLDALGEFKIMFSEKQ